MGKKKIIILLLFSCIGAISLFTACNSNDIGLMLDEEELVQLDKEMAALFTEYERYRGTFFDTFDTVVQVVAYTKTEEEFNNYLNYIEERYTELHKYYDIYNNYPGINNLKTINDHAGIEPVEVSQEIIDLILLAKDWHQASNGKMNVAMGSVLNIWHDYRTKGIDNPRNAQLPPMELLLEASKYVDINEVVVDQEQKTIYLTNSNMSLNVGAIAKGYTTELVVQEIIEKGFVSGIINAGGNVRVIGRPYDSARRYWGVGIQNPDKISILAEENILDTLYIEGGSVVSSGDNERYYIVDGKLYNHLIDPETLMPGDQVRAVSVYTEDSAYADFLSTVLFLLPFEESYDYANKLEGVEVLWILKEGTIKQTPGMKKYLKSQGASSGAVIE